MNQNQSQLQEAIDALDEDLQATGIQLERAKRDVRRIETERVGYRERRRILADKLARLQASEVKDFATTREVQIAHMLGFSLTVGDLLTPKIKQALRVDRRAGC